MTSRTRKLLRDAIQLTTEERSDLAAEVLATLPPGTAEVLHPDWLAEIERRARRAIADPSGGEAWEDVERRLLDRAQRR